LTHISKVLHAASALLLQETESYYTKWRKALVTKTTFNPHRRKQRHTHISAEDHDKLDVPVLICRLRSVGMGRTHTHSRSRFPSK